MMEYWSATTFQFSLVPTFHATMPKTKALYTDYPWADADIERERLAELGCELVISPDNREETLIELAPGCQVILTCWAPVTERVIAAAGNCKHIARTGIGLDNIDVPAATKRGILVTNVPDYCILEVAEQTIGSIFTLARNLHGYHLATKSGEYDLVKGLPVTRVEGKTLGIIGLGRIGSLVAQKALALGMQVVGTNRSQQCPTGVEWLPLEELLAVSDFVSLHAPLTDATRHLINNTALAQMKPTAALINTSRGGLVDHIALAHALEEGRLGGAALDVQDPEPPDLSQPPWNHPKVIVTPHIAFLSPEAVKELRTRVAQQTADFLTGNRPENIVNPEVLSEA